MYFKKIAALVLLCLGLGACFNDNEERRIHLGDISLGEQLIDLKKAHDAGAITKTEYRQMRQNLIQLVSDQQDDDYAADEANEEAEEDEEGFSWL